MESKKIRISHFFQEYHREEFQVVLLLLCLIIFFARTFVVAVSVVAVVLFTMLILYCMRLIDVYCKKQNLTFKLLEFYRKMKNALHVHSEERSRIAMAILASFVLLILCVHRIDLALHDPYYATPSDVYWIVFLGWYAVVCNVTGAYLIWLWRNWAREQVVRIPIMDGLVASMFFYQGLEMKERIVTYAAAFFLGGVPSYLAIKLSTETHYAYTIAVLLVIPVMIFTLGGAFYAKIYLTKTKSSSNPSFK